jgi:hypothetical protein
MRNGSVAGISIISGGMGENTAGKPSMIGIEITEITMNTTIMINTEDAHY